LLPAFHLRKLSHSPRPRWPFQLERIALAVVRIQIVLQRPRLDALTPGLFNFAKRQESAVDNDAGLFGEFPFRGDEGILIFSIFSLGNGSPDEDWFCAERALRGDEADEGAVNAGAVGDTTD